MTKNYFPLTLIVFLLIGLTSIAQTTAIPDPNFEQALIDLGIDSDGTTNGEVLTSDISGITDLVVNNRNINNLTGIEGFKALKNLSCSNNQITNLDVSKNLDLITFNCSTNYLTELNVTKNTKLTSLNFSQMGVSSIDLSQNIDLIYLNCAYNKLNALDVKNNTKLVLIDCPFNEIESIDIRKNHLLKTFYGSNNNFSILDFSLNKDITGISVSYNQLEELNLKNGFNFNISLVHAHRNPQLTCIQVDNPDLANAGIGNYSGWMEDDIVTYSKDCNFEEKTYVPDDNFEQALIDLGYDDVLDDYVVTSKISEIQSLNVTSKGINDLTGIEDFVSLTNLSCSNNYIKTLNVNQNKLLERLYCDHNQLVNVNLSGTLALKVLVIYNNALVELDVSQNPNLEYLGCLNNFLENLDVSKNLNLTTLSCQDTQLASLDVSNNTKLIDLSCDENQIVELNLSLNSALKTLSCTKNNLETLNIKNGANFQITRLDTRENPLLSCIQVDDEDLANGGVGNFSNWYKDLTTTYSEDCNKLQLTYVPDDVFEQELINLGYDDVMDNYVLTSNIKDVTWLEIGFKNITNTTGLEDFTSLTVLGIWGTLQLNYIDVSNNKSLSYLRIEETQITSIDVSQNTSLVDLFLDQNELTSIDISNNTSLARFRIRENQISQINFPNSFGTPNAGATGSSGSWIYLSENQLSSLDISNITQYLDILSTPNNPKLFCIQLSQFQMDNIATNWRKDSFAVYSLACQASLSDDDNDGVMNDIDRCPDTVSGDIVDIEGCSASQTLGVEDQKLDKSVKFFPNPVSNILSIKTEAILIEKVEIYSYLGIKISEIDSGFEHIQTDNLSKGIYIIKIYSEKGSASRRLIKQ